MLTSLGLTIWCMFDQNHNLMKTIDLNRFSTLAHGPLRMGSHGYGFDVTVAVMRQTTPPYDN